MHLIAELSEDVQYITELRDNGEKEHYLSGQFIIGDVKNKNGRLYPLSVLESEVNRYTNEMIKTGRALGECGHPSGPSINLERVSHRVIELKQYKNVFEGKALITSTPMGSILKGLLESGAKIGVSTRGLGSLIEKSGTMEVQNDFKLSAIDAVSDPSGPNCWVEGIMEGVEYFFDPIKDSWKEERVEEIKKQVKKLSKNEIEEHALSLFENYFSLLVIK
jgi:hypothetical protein